MSSRVLTELENIDDEAENRDIVMVKVDIDLDDKHILEKLGIPNNLPKLALFEEDQPAQLFEGMHLPDLRCAAAPAQVAMCVQKPIWQKVAMGVRAVNFSLRKGSNFIQI